MNFFSHFLKRHPIIRGMVTYAVLSPSSNATQQMLDPKREKFDPKECFRFGVLNALLVAPTLYGWVKLASIIVKGNTLKHCLLKAYIEQFTWAPFAYTQFYIGINALEGKSFEECWRILKEKFFPTYKVGFCIWPVVQTINFKFVPEKNRVPFVSTISFMWNVFLSYMHNRSWSKDDHAEKKSDSHQRTKLKAL